ncbi:MAG: STAS-like domain-containing protein [Methylobacter sp.]|uniref:STAS-like domain-containing protein n=1 Tax=Methylobacter sp. TaxID=2051955 RepID=UPI0027322A56|nr:STAS-like domain-containing protein [Methylobacter sp.]MDP1663538.1 STAS-like domain-containing protein [Methylobacter sp.]MDP1970468.1 STAS-like domain-containing protein [Methylobacter sp.]
MVIRILDYVPNASTYEDGEVIFKKILFEIKHDRPVTISFEGISSVPSAFINAAFIRLLEELTFEKIRTYLRITDSTKRINELIKSRFDFVVKNQKT